MLGSVLHLSMFCKALVFKWKVLSKKGSRTKAKSFFVCFVKRKTFLSKRRMGLFAAVFEEHYEKHGGEARSFCSSFNSFISRFISGLFEVIFYRRHRSLSRFLTYSSLLTAPRECTAEPGKAGRHVERKGGIETHKVNDQCKKDTIHSQGKQMDHASDLLHKHSIHTHTHAERVKADDRNCFLCHFFIQLIHFLYFIRDVILKKAKTSSRFWG